MKRPVIVVVVSLALVLGLAVVAVAQPQRGGPGPGFMGPGPDLPEQLKPTLQQKRQIHELRTAALRKAAPAEAELRVKASEMGGLWLADQPKRDAILKKLGEIDALHAKAREAWIDFELGMLKILTPAQRQTLAQLRGPGHMGGRGMGPGPGPHGPGMGPPPFGPGMGPPPFGPGMGPPPFGPGMGPGPGCPCAGPGKAPTPPAPPK
jgi:Spy/CpxP family protein refolding chaperone